MDPIRVFITLCWIVMRATWWMWPVSLVLVGILFSEIEHAPRKWECKHALSFLPLLISLASIAFTTLAICFPPLRLFAHIFGRNLIQALMCFQFGSAAFALYKLENNRCFFLSLLLLEVWIGFWCSIVAGAILMQAR